MNDVRPSPDPAGELDTLLARARAHRPDTSRAEYGFETRLMARLRSRRDTTSVWARVSWRAIPFFAACVLALTFWQAQSVSDANAAASLAPLNDSAALEVSDN